MRAILGRTERACSGNEEMTEHFAKQSRKGKEQMARMLQGLNWDKVFRVGGST